MPKRSSNPLAFMPIAAVEGIYAERLRLESLLGYPVCGEPMGGIRVCPLARFHSGRHFGER
jgi:hypothetical protein